MAAQATYYAGYGTAGRDETAATERAYRERNDPYLLREFPNEAVCFYRKPIDNSRVVREADPRARARCWRLIVTTCVATVALLAVFWPNVSGMLAGYEIESLKQEQQRLMTERTALELEEAHLLSPARLEELAQAQEFIDPSPGQIVYLNPKADGSLALNIGSKAGTK